jgi:hypothetical protein|tara:strand:- start:29 stop:274 length:246 start_codon:yes stop_codon:yes gene_type:complete
VRKKGFVDVVQCSFILIKILFDLSPAPLRRREFLDQTIELQQSSSNIPDLSASDLLEEVLDRCELKKSDMIDSEIGFNPMN